MSSIYFTGVKNHESGMTREYKDGSVIRVSYPANYRGKKYLFWQINRKEGKLKTEDEYNPFIGEDDSLSAIWDNYSSFIIGIIVLIAAVLAFLVYQNMSSPGVNVPKNVTENVTENVVENIVAAFGNIF